MWLNAENIIKVRDQVGAEMIRCEMDRRGKKAAIMDRVRTVVLEHSVDG